MTDEVKTTRTEAQIKNEINLIQTLLENTRDRKTIQKATERIKALQAELDDLEDVDTADLELNPSKNNPYFYSPD